LALSRLFVVVLNFFYIPSSIHRCLRMLCDEKRFYSDGHAFVVCQNSCRTAGFLVSAADLTEEFDEVLHLLTKLLMGYELIDIHIRFLRGLF